MENTKRKVIKRDEVTATGYLMLATFGWMIYTFGPAIPLIRDELGISRTLASLHSVTFAIGIVVAGLSASAFVRRVGRANTLRLGLLIMLVGVVGLCAGSMRGVASLFITLMAAGIAGLGVSLANTTAIAVLSDHHGDVSPSVLSEGNALTSGVGLIAPLALGLATASILTWRPVMLAIAIFAGLVALLLWRASRSPTFTVVPEAQTLGRLPNEYWLMWFALIACITVEFSIVAWSPDLVRDRLDLGPGIASTIPSAFLAGMFIGRIAVARLSLETDARRLFLASLGLALVGWILLWATTIVWVALLGLALAGLGAAGQFPLGSALLIRSAEGKTDRAVGIMAVGLGSAAGAGPFILAALADSFGIYLAFLLVPAGLITAASLSIVGAPRPKTLSGLS
jgi:fucose permease